MSIIQNLPYEINIKILKELNLNEIIKLRLISKKFKFIIDYYLNENELILDNYIEDSIKENKIKLIYKNYLLNLLSFRQFFIGIKKLKIKEDLHFFDLNVLNDFQNLISLSIYRVATKNDCVLDLPNLKLFDLYCNTVDDEEQVQEEISFGDTYVSSKELKPLITIKSKVESIIIRDLNDNRIHFEYPLEVKNLKIYDIDYLNINEFVNLKILTTIYFNDLQLGRIINNFNRLEKVHFCGWIESKTYIENEEKYNYNNFKEHDYNPLFINLWTNEIENIIKTITNHIYSFEIYFLDVNIISGKYDLYQFPKLIKKPIYKEIELETVFRLLNYNLLDNNFIYKHDYSLRFSKFMELIDGNYFFKNIKKDELLPKLPFDFFKKFNYFERITIENLNDEEEFLNFLKRIKFSELEIKKSVSQLLIDQLIDNFSDSLKSLWIRGNEHLNLENGYKFKKLEILYISEIELNVESILNLFKNLKYFRILSVSYLKKETSFSIHDERYDHAFNSINRFLKDENRNIDDHIFKFNYDQLTKFLENNKNEAIFEIELEERFLYIANRDKDYLVTEQY